ncbi:putative holin-like toxin [Paenibacillus dendritiformis]|nr:putative holin-like toxin [Paenibacillus dendritiformis]CAH8767826.1 putative holin-like toxin [Paenibacillus dendritiformis]
MTVFESVTLMISFGTFVIALIGLVITIVFGVLSQQNSKKQP